jgi:TatD DNase family protein
MFIDTHCHLNLIAKNDFESLLTKKQIDSLELILNRAKLQRVEIVLTVGTSIVESRNCILISKRFSNVYSVVGIHPCDCKDNWPEDFEKIEELVFSKKKNKIVGIGETGLDFYHKPYDRGRQILAFNSHIELAIKNNLPLVIHLRDSAQDVYDVLKEYKGKVNGVIHCFSENLEFAKKFLDLGFYLGFDGPVTYPKNDLLREVVKFTPLDRILLETDAPFLPPQQFRGKKNFPEYIPIFAKVIADLKNINLSELEDKTTLNAKKLFGI